MNIMRPPLLLLLPLRLFFSLHELATFLLSVTSLNSRKAVHFCKFDVNKKATLKWDAPVTPLASALAKSFKVIVAKFLTPQFQVEDYNIL